MKRLTPKEIRSIALSLFAAGVVLAWGGVLADEDVRLIVPGFLVMFGAIIVHLIFYRCPHCGRYLDRSTGEFCPHCGKRLNEKQE